MAETAKAEPRYKHGNESFPILYEDGRVQVYKNPTCEIFVEDIRSGATMRISSYPHLDGGLQFTTYRLDGPLQFATDGQVEPIQINNMIGWRVSPR